MRMLDNDYDYDNDNEPPRDFCTAPLGPEVQPQIGVRPGRRFVVRRHYLVRGAGAADRGAWGGGSFEAPARRAETVPSLA
jgi:hypothetical protein